MTYSNIIRGFILPLVALAVLVLGAARADARPVALWDAYASPSALVYLYPHASVTLADARGYSCHVRSLHGSHLGYFSDVSAYAWNGSAIGAQHYGRIPYGSGIGDSWRGYHGSVFYDGATFYNRTAAPVLVAGWCD